MVVWLFIALVLMVPPILFEYLLIAVSGRHRSAGNVVMSVALLAGAALWINADGKSEAHPLAR
jgi:hypothetical protein